MTYHVAVFKNMSMCEQLSGCLDCSNMYTLWNFLYLHKPFQFNSCRILLHNSRVCDIASIPMTTCLGFFFFKFFDWVIPISVNWVCIILIILDDHLSPKWGALLSVHISFFTEVIVWTCATVKCATYCFQQSLDKSLCNFPKYFINSFTLICVDIGTGLRGNCGNQCWGTSVNWWW